MNADGSGQRRITTSPYTDHYPTWSPDGRWLAFDRNINGQADPYLVSADGGQLVQLTNDPHTNEWDPVWLP
jgi:TolB protein